MNKLMAFFMFTFIAGTIIGLLMEGGSGMVATSITSSITAEDNVLPVASITGFKSGGDRLQIGKEAFTYTSLQISGINGTKTCPCLVGVDRGVIGIDGEGTTAAAHDGPGNINGNITHGSMVYNRGSAMVNDSLDFNIISSKGEFQISSAFENAKKLSGMVAKVITWDFSFLEGNFSYFKYIVLYPLSAGFVATLIIVAGNFARGILSKT